MNEKIREIMAKAFDVPVEKINESSSQNTVENWDSFHHVKLIVFLQRGLNIHIPDEKVGKMISYEEIKKVVDECKP